MPSKYERCLELFFLLTSSGNDRNRLAYVVQLRNFHGARKHFVQQGY